MLSLLDEFFVDVVDAQRPKSKRHVVLLLVVAFLFFVVGGEISLDDGEARDKYEEPEYASNERP